jgi:hypothetical protein
MTLGNPDSLTSSVAIQVQQDLPFFFFVGHFVQFPHNSAKRQDEIIIMSADQ